MIVVAKRGDDGMVADSTMIGDFEVMLLVEVESAMRRVGTDFLVRRRDNKGDNR